MVSALLELNAKFAESKTKGTLIKIAYITKDAQMIKLFVKHFMKK